MARPEERWAAANIESALPGVQVLHHDDGSTASMYDLDLVRDGQTFAVCEVTAAADAESIELWKLIDGGKGWIDSDLVGHWMLSLAPTCRIKRLKTAAPLLLARLEAEPGDMSAIEELRELGALHAHQISSDYPGRICATISRDPDLTSGFVADHSDALVEWFDAWIRWEDQTHNLRKLGNASPVERHLFVIFPAFASAPFGAADVLMRDDAGVPRMRPALPDPLSHIWLMSTWQTGLIFHWDSERWRTFPKAFEVS